VILAGGVNRQDASSACNRFEYEWGFERYPCKARASNAEMTACFISASKTADERLNKTYNHIRVVLFADEQRDLQAAQRLWLKFRDANCSAERNLYGGAAQRQRSILLASTRIFDSAQVTLKQCTVGVWRNSGSLSSETGCPAGVLSVITFHEKAGRSQVDSDFISFSRFFF
jgi:uncharacterized protein YecT (DUF1311 family)